jgi:Fe-S-cluster containining protein
VDCNQPNLWPAWRHAAERADIDAALRDLYARLDNAVAARGPTCWQSGKCCHFEAYGHRLYVTGLEIAWFLRQGAGQGPGYGDQESGERQPDRAATKFALPLIPDPRTPDSASGASAASGVSGASGDSGDSGGCPYQHENLCTVHAIRPLGCRVFFCQEGTQDWQQQLYEQFLNELRDLHDSHGLEYRYMEWRAGLHDAAACGFAQSTGDR